MSVEARLAALEKRLGELELLLEVVEDRIQALIDCIRDLEERSSGHSIVTTGHLEKDRTNKKDCAKVEKLPHPA